MRSCAPSGHPTVLPDILPPGLDIVFCGTGAGRRSAEIGAYYAGPGNRFWWALAETGLTPGQLSPIAFRDLPAFGIGLTDIAKQHVGPDAELISGAADAKALTVKIADAAPRFLAFTSKRAASLWLNCPTVRIFYGVQGETVGSTRIHVLPSPSGAARGHWSLDPWATLAREKWRSS
ncbi:G/U mismatch-specific uracil-DNA glycosylase [Stappia sp. ES.058]|nr:G/U mismatch-specific uracil-DNA glycosylase [Stappia sp. ES.058]